MNRFDGHEVKDWRPLLGHRVLAADKEPGGIGVFEAFIIELSPAGRPKVRFSSRSESWKNKDDVLLIEDLGETDIMFPKNV